MTRQEYLLTVMAEECNEVAQRCTKALRFGLNEVQPGQDATNADRIMLEYMDLIAIYQLLKEEGHLSCSQEWGERIAAKKKKVEQFYDYSRTLGVLHE